MKVDIRQRAHDHVRSELAEAAFDAIVEHGFEAMTADALAKQLGVSRATLFRYLGSKDDAVLGALVEADDFFAVAYSEADGRPGSWARLRQAVQPSVDRAGKDSRRMRARLELIRANPALGGRLRRLRAPQVERLADAVEASGVDGFAADVVASAAVAALDRAWVAWGADEQASLGDVLDLAFSALVAAGPAA